MFGISIHIHHHADAETRAALEKIMENTQATLAKLQAATASLEGIRSDIAALKALIAAGATPQEVADAVDSLTAGLATTDAEYPEP